MLRGVLDIQLVRWLFNGASVEIDVKKGVSFLSLVNANGVEWKWKGLTLLRREAIHYFK